MAATREPSVWGIHAGRTGDAHALFLEHSVVALGWARMRDLSALPDLQARPIATEVEGHEEIPAAADHRGRIACRL